MQPGGSTAVWFLLVVIGARQADAIKIRDFMLSLRVRATPFWFKDIDPNAPPRYPTPILVRYWPSGHHRSGNMPATPDSFPYTRKWTAPIANRGDYVEFTLPLRREPGSF